MQLGELLTGVWQFAYQNEVQSTNQGQQNLAYFLGYQNMSKQNAQSHKLLQNHVSPKPFKICLTLY